MKIILAIVLFSATCFTTNAQESTFHGKIVGIDSAEIEVLVLPLKGGADVITNKIQCRNGYFECKVKFNLDMWHLVILNSKSFETAYGKEKSCNEELKNREIRFFIQPKEALAISGKMEAYGINFQVTGNEINRQRNYFQKYLFPLEEEQNRLTICNAQKPENREFKTLLNSVNAKKDSLMLKLIGEHRDWIYSAEQLPEFPMDTVAKYYKLFTSEIQNSIFGDLIFKTLKASNVNDNAPLFTLQNDKGEYISLTDFKDKYIVLDFWGTWCGYCLAEIPRLKEYQSKYKDKIHFVGIACKDNKQRWLNAIAKHNLTWINLYAANEEITDNYGIEGYPCKIIIDKNGKIVLKTVGETEAFYQKLDELFK